MTLDRERTAEESAAQSQSQGQESRAPEMLPEIQDLAAYVEDNRLKVVPVKDEAGEVTGYDIHTRGDRQLFSVGKNDMTLAILKDTAINAASDSLEISSNFDMIMSVQQSLKRLGMRDADIPRTAHEVAEVAKTLMRDTLEIQKIKSEIDIQNNFQGLMAMIQKVYIGGEEEFKKLPKEFQKLVILISGPLVMRAMEQQGVGPGTVATTEQVTHIMALLNDAKRDAGLVGSVGKHLGKLGTSANKLLLGEDGIVEGVIENTDKLASKVIERTAEVAGRVKTGAVTNWRDNQNSKLEE